jgi:tetratricopeptide (TPR) repeat protein
MERALAQSASSPVAIRAKIATVFGLTMMMQGDQQTAGHWFHESLVLTRGLGDSLGATQALGGLGLVAAAEQNYDQATAHYNEALAVSSSIDDPRLSAIMTGSTLANLGIATRLQGRLEAAATIHEAALAKYREAGHVRGEAQSLLDLGEVAREQHDLARAFEHQRAGMLLAWEHNELHVIVAALEAVARTALLADRTTTATRLLAAAQHLRDQTGISWWYLVVVCIHPCQV